MQSKETVNSKLALTSHKFHWHIHNFELMCAKPKAVSMGEREPISNAHPGDPNATLPHQPQTHSNNTTTSPEGRQGRTRTNHWFYDAETEAIVDYREEHYCLLDIDFIQSSLFTVGQDDFKTTWFAYMKKKVTPHGEKLSFFLHMISGPPDSIIKHQFSVESSHGETLYQHRPSTMIMLSAEDSTGVEDFISVSRLYNDEGTFLAGDTLRICMDMQIIHDVIHSCDTGNESDMDSQSTELSLSQRPPPLPSLFQNVWKSKEFADMLAKCRETTQIFAFIPAHKFILSSGSPYLFQMIKSQSEARRSGAPVQCIPGLLGDSSPPLSPNVDVIDFGSLDALSLTSAFEFIYMGSIEEFDWGNFEVVSSLLKTAQLFEMEELLKYAFKTLCTLQLSLKSISSLVVFAFLFQAPENFKKKIYNFCLSKMELLKHAPEHRRMMRDYPEAFLPLLYKT